MHHICWWALSLCSTFGFYNQKCQCEDPCVVNSYLLFFTQQLPKVERELKKHIILYEELHKTPFKVYGESLIKIMENQWTLREDNKEQERKAKVRNWLINPLVPELFF
jgi:hypothetical protein